MNAKKPDIRQDITDTIIAAIEGYKDNPKEVSLPWDGSVTIGMPKNIASGKPYKGINVLNLWVSAHNRGFTENQWGTYKQWQDRGEAVARGQKGTPVIFYKKLEDDEDNMNTDASIEDNKPKFVLRKTTVFNECQLDGYVPKNDGTKVNKVEVIQKADDFIKHTNADVRVGGSAMAYYDIMRDFIQMPDKHAFKDGDDMNATEGFYAVLLHELTHWTSHKDRCDREIVGMGSITTNQENREKYALEELTAELGAAFLCSELGITNKPREDHAAYINHYLKLLKDDKNAIFKAARDASKAADYVYSLQPTLDNALDFALEDALKVSEKEETTLSI